MEEVSLCVCVCVCLLSNFVFQINKVFFKKMNPDAQISDQLCKNLKSQRMKFQAQNYPGDSGL